MKATRSLIALSLLTLPVTVPAWADGGGPFPKAPTFSTLITTPLAIEGMTGDRHDNLYVPARNAGVDTPCPVWRVNIENPALVVVGYIPAPSGGQCVPLGLAFDRWGRLHVADGEKIYRFVPDAATQPVATQFATGVPGANGLAFDGDGDLWVSDGTTGQGRVWRIDSTGKPYEMFRIEPLANEVNLDGAGIGGVGRDVRTLPPGAITVTPLTRNAQNILGSQPLVANGLAFDDDGDLIVSDTARGALWKVNIGHHGNVRSRMGCDTTFTPNTLCLENILVSHPLLEGADGIVLDRAGNIWVDANERNAVVVVDRNGRNVREVFRNPPDAGTRLRNGGPLEFNTSPVIVDRRFCTANLDANRRDNSPNSAGDLKTPAQPLGKISCMDQRLPVPGARLPVR